MNTPEKAKHKFTNGYNCAQSVFSSVANELGIDEEKAIHLSRAFGAGINYRAEMCGALSGAFMAIGLKVGNVTDSEELGKELTRAYGDEFISKFEKLNGSALCKGILGKDLSIPEELELLNKEQAFDKVCPNVVKSTTQILLETFKEIDDEQ
jgi:C_GCAxxG_C_C family probable redox protein